MLKLPSNEEFLTKIALFCEKTLKKKKNVILLHSQLGYGVMVTLQILVLSF